MTALKNKAEQIAPLLEQAIKYRIEIFKLSEQIHEIIAGELPEVAQIKADWIIENFISDYGLEAPDLTGLEYAEELLEKFKEQTA